jgi:signal transduction histidine kinase
VFEGGRRWSAGLERRYRLRASLAAASDDEARDSDQQREAPRRRLRPTVAIQDTGAGIPEAIPKHVFEPFFTTKRVGRGSGQGLALAHTVVVERHGGTLTFESEMGRGTTFFVRLPIAGRSAVRVSTVPSS